MQPMPDYTLSVAEKLKSRTQTGELQADPVQLAIAARLDRILSALKLSRSAAKTSALGWLFAARRKQADPVRGLYVHGSVGRGKTMLMDMFFDLAPVRRKRRVHFNDFMTDAHDRIQKHRQARKDGAVHIRNAEKDARHALDEMFGVGDDNGIGRDIVFHRTVRHSEAVASQARNAGLLAYELDVRAKDEAKAGIAWWKIRSGELKNKQLTSSTAGSVAGDLRAIAQEINDRLIAAESHPELEGTHA